MNLHRKLVFKKYAITVERRQRIKKGNNKASNKIKHCFKCKVKLTKDNWYAGDKNYTPPRYKCKSCSDFYRRYWRGLSKNFTQKDYDNSLEQQNGLCALCEKPERRKFKGIVTKLQIDHDHKTGEARGLLCWRCNYFLGIYELYKDKFEKYLKGD